LMVVPHGRFGRRGFERAIVRAAEGTRRNVVAHTGEALAAAGALRQAPLAGGVPDASEEPSDAAPSPPPPSAPATSLRASQ
jgi:glycerol-3-phosphate acyltransferase PlsX